MPLSGRTLVDEDRLLDQLDLIRLNLPPAFHEAAQIVQQRDAVLAEAQRYAQELIEVSEQQATQRLDELGIVRQAEQMAQQIKAQAQQDCDALRSQVIIEIDQMRLQAQRDWETLQQQALAEQAAIQSEADAYADDMLTQLERQLSEMLRVVQIGKQQLQQTPEPTPPVRRPPPAGPTTRSSTSPSRPDRPRR